MARIRISCKKDGTTLTPSYLVDIEGEEQTQHLTAIQDILVERSVGSYSIKLTHKEKLYHTTAVITKEDQEFLLVVRKNPKLWWLQVGFLGLLLVLLLLTNITPSTTLLTVATITLLSAAVGYVVGIKKLAPIVIIPQKPVKQS